MYTNYLVKTAEEHKQFTIGKLPKENIWFCNKNDFNLNIPRYVDATGEEEEIKLDELLREMKETNAIKIKFLFKNTTQMQRKILRYICVLFMLR